MPWWAWLLVDLAIFFGALTVVVRAGWRFWKRIRAFLSAMATVWDEVPSLPHR